MSTKLYSLSINIAYFLLAALCLSACSSSEVHETPEEKRAKEAAAQKVIDQSILAHGGNRYEKASISFDFRDKHYTSIRSGGNYQYTREFQKDSETIRDVLSNAGFQRFTNGQLVELNEKKSNAYLNSVNSVLYFMQLPYGLNDAAVIKRHLGTVEIEGKAYDKIRVSFQEEGGGQDFEDVFIYWINQESSLVDYLAYEYHTDGGGMRFRKAINQRVVNGITFADYINYKPKGIFTDLYELDQAYTQGALEEVSRIINTNIKVALAE
ncbi:MAG: DUF6503 family protein [Flammeovirgaceae bacterium]